MKKTAKADMVKHIIMGAREYGINTVLFRNIVADRLGVNVTDMECLGLLFHKGIATPSDLSKHTGLSSGATTAMLDRLEKSELIERKPNLTDRRGTLITINTSGSQKIAHWFVSGRNAQNKIVSSYTTKELQIIASFFEKMKNMWEEERKKLLKEVINK